MVVLLSKRTFYILLIFAFLVCGFFGFAVTLFSTVDILPGDETRAYLRQLVSDTEVLKSLGLDALLLGKVPFHSFLSDETRPGLTRARELGLRAHHPVVMVPGVVSSALELWESDEACASGWVREYLWSSIGIVPKYLFNRACWLSHMMLDAATGLDPPGKRVRAVFGLQSSEYLIPGFFIWARLVSNLNDIGYDSNSLHMASYDWRLGTAALETRDGFYTKLMRAVEGLSQTHAGRRCVLVSHSMGSTVLLHFLQFAEFHSPGWVARHVEAQFHIGGTLLGTWKALSLLLSGDAQNTARLGVVESNIVEQVLPRALRTSLFRSWPSVASLLPRGGEALWRGSRAEVVGERDGRVERRALGLDATLALLFARLPPATARLYGSLAGLGVAGARELGDAAFRARPQYWSNPLQSVLPGAANVSVFCAYGYTKPTEIGYVYAENADGSVQIDTAYSDDARNVSLGVLEGEGDGTVPLLSLGYMCAEGWRNRALPYNPHGVRSVVLEYEHRPVSLVVDLRGGVQSADHVDIMGSHELALDFLLIVSGNKDMVQEKILSDLPERARAVDLQLEKTPPNVV